MATPTPSDTNVIADLSESYVTGAPYTPPSKTLGAFDLDRGYELQRAYIAEWCKRDTLAGFKAAVTAPPMQKAFGLPGPVTSVLFARGVRNNNSEVSLGDFRGLLVETELCYRLNTTVSQPVADIEAVKALVARVSPAFELADPGFGSDTFTGEDLVATNIACGGWIEGDEFDWRNTDLDAITVDLTHNGEPLHSAAAGSVIDGQWPALLWLINQSVAQGYKITPEHFLITGAIGAAHPGKPGHYVAEFGGAGSISFELTANELTNN